MSEYVTGPVDPTKPMELDDGRPVTLCEYEPYEEGHTVIAVWVVGPYERYTDYELPAEGESWTYSLATGVWVSGTAEDFYVLRNRQPPQMLSPFRKTRKLQM